MNTRGCVCLTSLAYWFKYRGIREKGLGYVDSAVCYTIYTTYPSAHKQLRRILPNLFREFPCSKLHRYTFLQISTTTPKIKNMYLSNFILMQIKASIYPVSFFCWFLWFLLGQKYRLRHKLRPKPPYRHRGQYNLKVNCTILSTFWIS